MRPRGQGCAAGCDVDAAHRISIALSRKHGIPYEETQEADQFPITQCHALSREIHFYPNEGEGERLRETARAQAASTHRGMKFKR